MASKKQRRRREKLQRHEWEEVYVDEEGRELAPEEAEELVPARQARAAKGRPAPKQRGVRTVEPPSWKRTGKRGLLFFPLMLFTVFLVGGDMTLPQQVAQTLVLMAFFLPFSYFMDSLVWRSYQKRLLKAAEPKKR
jgi:hypothetical protein